MERRRQYRVDTTSGCPLTAWIQFRGGRVEPVEIVNLSDSGARIRLSTAQAPALMFGERITIGFAWPGGSRGRMVPAVIRFSSQVAAPGGSRAAQREFGVWFRSMDTDNPADDSFRRTTLRSLFNRRSTQRGEPDPAALPLAMSWRSVKGDLPGVRPIDCSSHGMALLAGPHILQQVGLGDVVWVQLHMPALAAPTQTRAIVRNRAPAGTSYRIGLEFQEPLARPQRALLPEIKAPLWQVA